MMVPLKNSWFPKERVFSITSTVTDNENSGRDLAGALVKREAALFVFYLWEFIS